MIELLKNLINNLGYVVIIAFFVSNLPIFKNIIQKDEYGKKELVTLTLIFCGFSILGTYAGTSVNGAIANTRIIGVMAGGILFGPYVGIISGGISGVHRLIIDMGGITSIPCAITTVLAGFLSYYIYKRASKEEKRYYGLIGGILIETFEMILILLLSRPYQEALAIVKSIYFPMSLANGIGIFILIALIQNNFKEKEEIAATQAQLALEIASKTLPYFRDITPESLEKVCEIIKDSTKAAAVAITDKAKILAHVGMASDHHVEGEKFITSATLEAIKHGELRTLNNAADINCPYKDCPLKSAIIVPLKENDEIIGTLKIYYDKENGVSYRTKKLAIGLSQIISTQVEISKVSKLKDMATKAEIKALQAQINPHFLFNALNTIVSFLRIDPNKARELIINLSTYLRYNLDYSNSFVDISKELEQVKAYVEVEKARFGEKLQVLFNIQEGIDIKVPSLIIQPIVENSIKHGILKGTGAGKVIVNISSLDDSNVEISVEDDGVGIKKETIENIYNGTMKENKIGISNVNSRLKHIYGKGLIIEQLNPGTKISFIVYNIEE